MGQTSGLSRPADRFADRAEAYDLGRPDYAAAALDQLCRPGSVRGAASIADVGAGTGILSAMLLSRGYQVVAVEPSPAMRGRSDRRHGHHPGYRSTAGSAEHTGLPDSSVEAITVGQALHWFELDRARQEFGRILRPGGTLLFLWNTLVPSEVVRAADGALSALVPAYVTRKTAEPPTAAELVRAVVPDGATLHQALFDHQHALGEEGFLALFLSASYAPGGPDPLVTLLTKELAAIFRSHQRGGAVTLHYRTRAITGVCAGGPADGGPG